LAAKKPTKVPGTCPRRIQAGYSQAPVQAQDPGADIVQNVLVLLHYCPIFERFIALRLLKKQK
jgi:hypothetical protein